MGNKMPETKPNLTTKCPCGETIAVIWGYDDLFDEYCYQICNIKCPKCGRTSTGGNCKTGEVYPDWITPRDLARSNAEYQAQCFDADNNEFYGRGNW